ncbi:hypothetical protein SAMN02910382_01228 [Butyrivibrio sp. TB]|nr:hypothetical protein SAMN02910382_01228 [Butyrivibrio sp. TB]
MLEARNDGLKHGNNGKGGKIAAGGVFWVHLFVKLAFCEEMKIALYSRLYSRLPAPDGCDESGFDIPTDLLEKVISEVPF